jgi:hypothetical protein
MMTKAAKHHHVHEKQINGAVVEERALHPQILTERGLISILHECYSCPHRWLCQSKSLSEF